MTLKELSQLSDLNGEIKLLEDQLKQKRIDYAAACSEPRVEHDTVEGSSRSWPYCRHTMTVEGVAKEVTDARERARGSLSDTIARLWDMRARAARKQQEIIEYIDAVPDSRIRQILTLRFVDELHWCDVAAKMGADESEGSVKMACKRYLEKI